MSRVTAKALRGGKNLPVNASLILEKPSLKNSLARIGFFLGFKRRAYRPNPTNGRPNFTTNSLLSSMPVSAASGKSFFHSYGLQTAISGGRAGLERERFGSCRTRPDSTVRLGFNPNASAERSVITVKIGRIRVKTRWTKALGEARERRLWGL